MLPEKKKELIIWVVSIIGVILVIIIMYNFTKFMRGLGETPAEEIVYDDPYPDIYTYFGFALDEDGNYQLMGLDSEFLETKLGLRSFYSMDNLYYYDNHLVLYTDAINQINYNKEEETFMFYEQNSFFSHSTDVIITPSYYVFITDETLEYCLAPDCTEMTTITDQLADTTVLYTSDSLFYLLNDGVYEYNLEDKESTHIVLNEMRTFKLLATNEDYFMYYQKMVEQSSSTLSNAALETLAIIAYNQPITRLGVEDIRGVGCDAMIRKLVAKALIKEVGREDSPGMPILYGVTDEFMDAFGLTSLDELPDLADIVEIDEQEDIFATRYRETDVEEIGKKESDDSETN